MSTFTVDDLLIFADREVRKAEKLHEQANRRVERALRSLAEMQRRKAVSPPPCPDCGRIVPKAGHMRQHRAACSTKGAQL